MYSPEPTKAACEPHFCSCDKNNKHLNTGGYWWWVCKTTSIASRIDPENRQIIKLDLKNDTRKPGPILES
jgi:hypothetical protein